MLDKFANKGLEIVTPAEIAKRLPWTRGVKLLECDSNGLLAIEKPAGLLSHPNRKGDFGKALLAAPYDEKKQAYAVGQEGSGDRLLVYLLNRLDSATSGVVLLSIQEDTASAVLKSFEEKKVRKTYEAIVFGVVPKGPPLWRDRLSVTKAEGGVRASAGGALSAETKIVRTVSIQGVPLMSRLTLMPLTGRTHQLRIQTSKRNVPIVGDRTYGDFHKNKMVAKKGMKRLCLHCVKTELSFSLKGKSHTFAATSAVPF